MYMQTLLGDGPGGCSSDKLKRLNRDIDMLVEEVCFLEVSAQWHLVTVSLLLQLDHLGRMGRVEETHELMTKLEVLEKERESERLALSNSAPKVVV